MGIGNTRADGQRSGISRGIRRRELIAGGFALGATLQPGLAAAPPAPVPLTPQDNADLQRIASYLNSIHTMYAKFRQVSAGNVVATGQL